MSSPASFAPAALSKLLATAGSQRFEYPWPGLEDFLLDAGFDELALAGYGSLLHPDSARRTIPGTPADGHLPIIAFGARRLFNYVIPTFLLERYGVDPHSNDCAALNSAWTGNVDDRFNARLVTIPIADLDGLRMREIAYDLAPVAWQPWNDHTIEPELAFTLCATSRPFFDTVWVSPDILPCLPYLDLCRTGARRVSPDFDKMFIDTTTLADGCTPLRTLLDEKAER